MGPAFDADRLAGTYLTFCLGSEHYAAPAFQVREIMTMVEVNPVPCMPDHFRGLINLRGEMVSVVELRSLMSMPAVPDTESTCMIIMDMQTSDMAKCWEVKKCGNTDCPSYENADRRCWMTSGKHSRSEIQGTFEEKIQACRKCDVYSEMTKRRTSFSVAVVVDEVNQVEIIKADQIQPIPSMGAGFAERGLLAVAAIGEHMTVLLNMNMLLAANSEVLDAALDMSA